MMRFSDLRAKISISSSSFASIIASNQIYVDKTSYIYDLCVDNNFKFSTVCSSSDKPFDAFLSIEK